jgi:hypothetical protein
VPGPQKGVHFMTPPTSARHPPSSQKQAFFDENRFVNTFLHFIRSTHSPLRHLRKNEAFFPISARQLFFDSFDTFCSKIPILFRNLPCATFAIFVKTRQFLSNFRSQI